MRMKNYWSCAEVSVIIIKEGKILDWRGVWIVGCQITLSCTERKAEKLYYIEDGDSMGNWGQLIYYLDFILETKKDANCIMRGKEITVNK